MKLLIVLSLVALAVAAPPPLTSNPSGEVQLLRFENDNYDNHGYNFGFEQSDGQAREEQGELRNEGREDEYIAVKGSYSWVGPDGVKYIVRYIADENGFQPEMEEEPGFQSKIKKEHGGGGVGGGQLALITSLLG